MKPNHLSAIGIEAWGRIQAECAAKQIDCSGKYDVLERYAVTYQLWLECQAFIRTEKQLLVDGQRNPRMTDYHQLTINLGKIRNELGLGPIASSKLREQEDEAEAPRRKLKILRNG